ncbi:MAG: nucleotidyltransferase domain-containing protein [Anaerolineales bacterium]|nr:nucleotidyltransferase domain-containing protein [Anaerolineales bacterium]
MKRRQLASREGASPEQLVREVADWWSGEPDAVAAVLVGSRARGTAKAESDLDIILLSRDPTRYLRDTSWAAAFGTPDRMQLEAYGDVTSLRVWYRAGPEVEFGLTSAAWASDPVDKRASQVIREGIRILADREGVLAARVQAILSPSPSAGGTIVPCEIADRK